MAGKIGAVADKTAGYAERMGEVAEKTDVMIGTAEGCCDKMEDLAKRMGEVAEKMDVMADTADGGCDKFAPISQVVGIRVAQLFAQAGDVQMVSKRAAWNGRKRDDGRGFCLKMLYK